MTRVGKCLDQLIEWAIKNNKLTEEEINKLELEGFLKKKVATDPHISIRCVFLNTRANGLFIDIVLNVDIVMALRDYAAIINQGAGNCLSEVHKLVSNQLRTCDDAGRLIGIEFNPDDWYVDNICPTSGWGTDTTYGEFRVSLYQQPKHS